MVIDAEKCDMTMKLLWLLEKLMMAVDKNVTEREKNVNINASSNVMSMSLVQISLAKPSLKSFANAALDTLQAYEINVSRAMTKAKSKK